MTVNDKRILKEASSEWSNPQEQKEWLSPKETHKFYGFSVSNLSKWRMNRMNLPFHKMGNYIRYKRTELEAFIESNKIEVA